ITIPGLRCDLGSEAGLTPRRKALKARLLALNPGVRGLPTSGRTRLKLLETKAVRQWSSIYAGNPRIHLSIRIKHRCLLCEMAPLRIATLEHIFKAIWMICMPHQRQLPHFGLTVTNFSGAFQVPSS